MCARMFFCTPASPGFVYPMIGIARAAQRLGHSAAFATASSFSQTLNNAGIERMSLDSSDEEGFQIAVWGVPRLVALQIKQIEHAFSHFNPDVLVGHSLTRGSMILSECRRLEVS